MGLTENPFGWMWVNGAEESHGFSCLGPITRHRLHGQEQTIRYRALHATQGRVAAQEILRCGSLSLPPCPE